MYKISVYNITVGLSMGFLWLSPVAMGVGPTGEHNPAQGQILTQDQVRLVQERLKAERFDPGPIDGVMDSRTEAALRQYQIRHGIPVSGSADEATLRQLQIQLTPSGGGTH
jgi:peptidoglycan hydrolase-like protein with peptidoglycan-binding domain